VAFLLPTAPDDVDTPVDRVRAGLAELGYVNGQTVSLEARFAHHRQEQLPVLAAELVATQPDVIHTWTTPAARALAAATSTIPIVAAPIGEVGLSELVGDMVRPAGNITGLTLDRRDQQEKCLQILKEAAPHITRVGVLRNPLVLSWRHYPEVLHAARALGLELVGADARGPEEIEAVPSTAQRLSISSQYIGGFAQRRAILLERLVGLSEGNVREVGPVLFELPRKVLGLGGFAPQAVVPMVVKPTAKLDQNGKVGVAPSSLDCGLFSAHWVSAHAATSGQSEPHRPNAFLRLQASPISNFLDDVLLPCTGEARHESGRLAALEIVSDNAPDIALEGAAGVA
jgi:ABC transporter substrate binding protein